LFLSQKRQLTFYNVSGNPEWTAGVQNSPNDNGWLPKTLCPPGMTGDCNQLMSLMINPVSGYSVRQTELFQAGAALSGHARVHGNTKLKPQ
jgi:hypothetical protein